MRRMLALVGALALLAGACGSDSDDAGSDAADDGARTVEVTMRDIEFDPESIAVQRGETIRFVFENEGKLPHDAFIGDAAAQAEHEEEVRAAEGEDGGHGHAPGDIASGIVVDPGARGELTHRFDQAGELLIGCHEPGHYEAGMRGVIAVS